MNDFCASIRCLAAMSGKRKSSCGFQHFPTFQLLVPRTTAVLKSRSSLQVRMTKTALATLKLVYVRIHGAMQFTHIERQALVDPSPGWEALILYGEILCRKPYAWPSMAKAAAALRLGSWRMRCPNFTPPTFLKQNVTQIEF